jgi:hypothetical protein
MKRNGIKRTGLVLVRQITTLANAIAAVDPSGLQAGELGPEVGEAVVAQCRMCLAAINEALAEPSEPGLTIPVLLDSSDVATAFTLREVEEWCQERTILANTGLYRVRIQQALLQAGVWVGELDAPDGLSEDQAALAAETGHYLLQVLQEAQATGVAPGTPVAWNATTITLTAASQLADYVATTAGRRKRSLKNA